MSLLFTLSGESLLSLFSKLSNRSISFLLLFSFDTTKSSSCFISVLISTGTPVVVRLCFEGDDGLLLLGFLLLLMFLFLFVFAGVSVAHVVAVVGRLFFVAFVVVIDDGVKAIEGYLSVWILVIA